jgi:hypothetical protein
MKTTLYFSAIKLPFDCEYSLKVTTSDYDSLSGITQKKLGAIQIDVPTDIRKKFDELAIVQLEEQLFEAFRNYENRSVYLKTKISQLNTKNDLV